ncbi:MAG TPA: hypothetical protein VLN59_18175 [Burkholderiales bacterium]|nr:hypothetical protein [Burkholderiales bacterium]
MNTPQLSARSSSTLRALPAGIRALGLGSMFMDISSEMIHNVLPVFMASVLGASMVTIGIVEGVAEATSAITKVSSGALSDYLRKRKFLLVLGYALAALTKPSATFVAGAAFAAATAFGLLSHRMNLQAAKHRLP